MYYSKRDIRFQLYELLHADALLKYPYFEDHSRDSFDMVIEAADQIGEKMLFPLLTEMDRQEPQLIDGKIRVHEGMKAIVKRFGDDGWINAPFSYDPTLDADFYQGKIMTAKYFFEYELVKVDGLAKRLSSDEKVTIEMQNAWF